MTRLRLLLADDHEAIRVSLAMLLRRRVGELAVASDGEEAWRIYSEKRVDVVMTDLRMPHLDGVALARRIRAKEDAGERRTTVIATSAAREDDAAVLGDRSLFDYALSKPLSPPQLFELLERIALEKEGGLLS